MRGTIFVRYWGSKLATFHINIHKYYFESVVNWSWTGLDRSRSGCLKSGKSKDQLRSGCLKIGAKDQTRPDFKTLVFVGMAHTCLRCQGSLTFSIAGWKFLYLQHLFRLKCIYACNWHKNNFHHQWSTMEQPSLQLMLCLINKMLITYNSVTFW